MVEKLHRPSEDNHGTPPQGDDQPIECNCIKEVKERFLKHKLDDPKAPEGLEISEVDFRNYSWFPKTRLYSELVFESSFIKKTDGKRSKPKKSIVNIFFTYCPFCGQKTQ